ncbi:MAG: methyl-accepting chemotaxis protein [Syntrophobacteraceae bacterium]
MNLKVKIFIFLLLSLASSIIAFHGAPAMNMHLMATSLSCGVVVLWTIYMFRSTVIPLRSSIGELTEAVDESEKACTRYYTSAKALADGAGLQAANLEETAASLEQVTGATMQNAENADKGRSLIEEALSIVNRAGASMSETSHAMEDISAASAKISEIIKEIDGIAFQTNLLALNAAVEAARAGDHGAGFAVVADEVRNLAKRSAAAARGTQELIQSAINKTGSGVALMKRTESDFSEMLGTFEKSVTLIREIAESSAEQRINLKEISKSISQIDTVTQKNAERASESAEDSEQLEVDAQKLRTISATLQEVLSGTNRKKQAMDLVKKGMTMARKKGLEAVIAAARDKNGPFCSGDEWYIYIGTTRGKVTLLAHPFQPEKLVGPDLSQLEDIKGRKFFNDLMATALEQGAGWVNYWWPKPGEATSSLKSTYLEKVPGEDAYIACGIYV